MPCEGVFVDVKELPPLKVENENDEIFIELYRNYKKFFETSDAHGIYLDIVKYY